MVERLETGWSYLQSCIFGRSVVDDFDPVLVGIVLFKAPQRLANCAKTENERICTNDESDMLSKGKIVKRLSQKFRKVNGKFCLHAFYLPRDAS